MHRKEDKQKEYLWADLSELLEKTTEQGTYFSDEEVLSLLLRVYQDRFADIVNLLRKPK